MSDEIDARVVELGLDALSAKMAELTTRLLKGETLSRGDLMHYAACVGAKYHTPELAALFAKRERR